MPVKSSNQNNSTQEDNNATTMNNIYTTQQGDSLVYFEKPYFEMIIEEQDENLGCYNMFNNMDFSNAEFYESRAKSISDKSKKMIQQNNYNREYTLYPQKGTNPYNKDKKLYFGRAYNPSKLMLKDLPNELRQSVCNQKYTELDLKSAHPSIIKSLAYDYKDNDSYYKDIYDKITTFMDSKEEIIQNIIDQCGFVEPDDDDEDDCKDIVKQLYQRLMYMGSLKQWCKDKNVSMNNINQFTKDFEKNMNKNLKYVIETHPRTCKMYDILYNHVSKYKKPNEPDISKIRSTVSFVFQTIEREIIQHTMNYMNTNEIGPYYTYIYDSVVVNKNIQQKNIQQINKKIQNDFQLHFIKYELKKLKNKDKINKFNVYYENHKHLISFNDVENQIKKEIENFIEDETREDVMVVNVAKFFNKYLKNKYVFPHEGHNAMTYKVNEHGILEQMKPYKEMISKFVNDYSGSFEFITHWIQSFIIKDYNHYHKKTRKLDKYQIDDDTFDGLEKKKRQKNLIKTMRSKIEYSKNDLVSKSLSMSSKTIDGLEEKMDTYSQYIGFTNGVLDIYNFQFYEYCPKGIYISKTTGYDFDWVDNDDEDFKNAYDFIRQYFHNEELFQSFKSSLGELLCGMNNKSHSFHIWCSKGGRSGKGITKAILQHCLKNRTIQIDNSMIIQNNNQDHKAPSPSWKKFKTNSVVFCDESGSQDEGKNSGQTQFSSSLIKKLSAGDSITARNLYENSEEFHPLGRLVMIANSPPSFANIDPSMIARMNIYEYSFSFYDENSDNYDPSCSYHRIADNNIESKFKNIHPLYFFHVLFDGYQDYVKNNYTLTNCNELNEVKNRYRLAMDPIYDFMKNQLVYQENSIITKDELIDKMKCEEFIPSSFMDNGNKPNRTKLYKEIDKNASKTNIDIKRHKIYDEYHEKKVQKNCLSSVAFKIKDITEFENEIDDEGPDKGLSDNEEDEYTTTRKEAEKGVKHDVKNWSITTLRQDITNTDNYKYIKQLPDHLVKVIYENYKLYSINESYKGEYLNDEKIYVSAKLEYLVNNTVECLSKDGYSNNFILNCLTMLMPKKRINYILDNYYNPFFKDNTT